MIASGDFSRIAKSLFKELAAAQNAQLKIQPLLVTMFASLKAMSLI